MGTPVPARHVPCLVAASGDCKTLATLPHPVPHSLIHQVRREGGNCQGPGAMLGVGEEFSAITPSHRLEEEK